jgi:hypothetical protein
MDAAFRGIRTRVEIPPRTYVSASYGLWRIMERIPLDRRRGTMRSGLSVVDLLLRRLGAPRHARK